MTIASTRGGKGVALIVPTLLRYRASCIVIDPKGENAWITAKYRRETFGHKTIILDPWGEVNRRYGDFVGEQEQIATFNPLSVLDPASEHYADDVAYIADALIINEGKVYRQHYAYQVKDGSIVFEGPWTTEAKAGTISGGDFRLVLTKRGRDGNQRKPCTFRLTFSGGAQALTISKEVKFDSEAEYFLRNEYQLVRP